MVIEIVAVGWDDPRGEALRAAQRVELAIRYETPDSEPGPPPGAHDIALFLVAMDAGTAIGCGGLRPIDDSRGEVKRMYVVPERRGSGVSAAILRALEAAARDRGWTRLLLETGDRQPDAIRFYEREGYERIPNFGHYVGSDISLCYAKPLT